MSIPLHTVPARLPVNLRTRVFVPVFVLACAASLIYVFARDPVYVSTARLQVEGPRIDDKGKDGDRLPNLPNLLNATQALTGSTVMDQVKPLLPPGQAGADALRGMLSATPIAGSNVIELRAEGGNGAILPQILAAWIDAYRRSQADSFDRSSAQALEEARDTLARAKQDLAAKRQDVEQFRRKHDIVSLEREENQTTARLKALNAAMNEARNREVNAEARLNGIRESLAAGKAPPAGMERSIVVELEKRASDLRERMKELEQDYTPHFLAADTKYKTMRANLVRLEQQIEQEKKASGGRAVQKEEEELASARQTVARLREELSARKREAQDFMARFSENAALEKELARLEEAQGSAAERVARLEGEKRAPRPELTVLNLPTVPDRPDRPDYWRDAAIAVAGAGVLGFLAVWFVEFFQRSGVPRPDAGVQPVIHISYPGVAFDAGAPAIGAPAPLAIGGTAARLPETIAHYARELSAREVRALWEAASSDARLTIAGLFAGMSLEEIAALRYAHMDPDVSSVRIPVRSGRSCTLRDPLRRLLIERRAARGGDAPLADDRGQLLTVADLEGLVACAAHDAGLANAGEVTSETVRHTYLAYLVRQGARLAELGEFIGHIPPAAYREYGLLSPPGPGLPLEDVDPVYPVLRDLQR